MYNRLIGAHGVKRGAFFAGLWQTRGDRKRALELAAEAAANTENHDDRREIQLWLDARKAR